jgi:hypothetical protein
VSGNQIKGSRSAPTPSPSDPDSYDHAGIKALAKETGLTMVSLTVTQHDPFTGNANMAKQAKTKAKANPVRLPAKAARPGVKNQKIALSDITVPHKRMRHLQLDKIDEIAESIKYGLLLQPIVIRPKPNNMGVPPALPGWQ